MGNLLIRHNVYSFAMLNETVLEGSFKDYSTTEKEVWIKILTEDNDTIVFRESQVDHVTSVK